MTNRASLTAEYMALFRALESSRPANARLFHDPFAAIFLRSWRQWLHLVGRTGIGRRFAETLLDHWAPGARAAGIARTKWIDDEAINILGTARQLVLLGAGFDTRAYRLGLAPRVSVFELDQSETSVAKRTRLQRALGRLPHAVRFVEVDFNHQAMADALLAAGFDGSQHTCWIWEGVTNYLSSAAVDTVLQEIRRVAPRSTLIFTYLDRAVLDQPEQFFHASRLIARLKSYNEPWTFGLRPPEVRDYLARRKFDLLKETGVAQVRLHPRRFAQSVRGYEFYRLAVARAIQPPGLLGEPRPN